MTISFRVIGEPAPRDPTTGRLLPKHGWYGTPEYGAWIAMKKRCGNPRNASYARYGGRGIGICDRWAESFDAFISDMGPRPGKGYSLGRINNDLGYSPENCRWETARQQQSNRSSVRLLTFNGETFPLALWSRRCGISRSTLRQRLENGWAVERALTQSTDRRRASR